MTTLRNPQEHRWLAYTAEFDACVMPVPEAGCWLWIGPSSGRGYGGLTVGGVREKAHRISWLIHRGEIGSFFVCHKCDTPACVNPDHLFLGTMTDNMRDMARKGRHKPGRQKLTHQQVRAIFLDGRPKRVIGREYGIDNGHVVDIQKRNRWARVTSDLCREAKS